MLQAFSFGGGVQSTAALVLSARGEIPYRVHVMADVGEDSEHPDTVVYVRDVAAPYAAANGLQLVTVRKATRRPEWESILAKLQRTATSIDIPVRMANGAPGRRSCTADYKILPVARWVKAQGATDATPSTVGVGISLDEADRMRDSRIAWVRNAYPLVELGLTRADCEQVINEAGLPPAPRSACWFCPFQRPARWLEMRDGRPDLWAKAVELEASLNLRREALGKEHVFFTGLGRPLQEAIELWVDRQRSKRLASSGLPDGQAALFDGWAEDFSCGPFACASGLRGAA